MTKSFESWFKIVLAANIYTRRISHLGTSQVELVHQVFPLGHRNAQTEWSGNLVCTCLGVVPLQIVRDRANVIDVKKVMEM